MWGYSGDVVEKGQLGLQDAGSEGMELISGIHDKVMLVVAVTAGTVM